MRHGEDTFLPPLHPLPPLSSSFSSSPPSGGDAMETKFGENVASLSSPALSSVVAGLDPFPALDPSSALDRSRGLHPLTEELIFPISSFPSSPSSSPSPAIEFGAFSTTKHSDAPQLAGPNIGSPREKSGFAASSSTPPLPSRVGATSPAAATEDDIGVPRPLESLHAVPIPPFLSKTYELVDDPALHSVVSWGSSGVSFVVWDPVEFSRTVLPRLFKHNNFSSFVRQLNTYIAAEDNFLAVTMYCILISNVLLERVAGGFRKIDTDRWEFANENFLRGKKHLLRNIHRRRSSQSQQIGAYLGSSTEMGKHGLEGEVEKLRRNKNLLMQEVMKLQKNHLTTIRQMDTMKQRMRLAERRQNRMVSFLAKFPQNPTFLDHLKQQKEWREISSVRVKRKFLKQQQAKQSELGSPRMGKIVMCKQDLIDVTSSPLHQDSGAEKQLPEYLLQEMEDKHGLDASRQEFLGTSDESGMKIPETLGLSEAPYKGKNVMCSSADDSDGSTEHFVSLPEELSRGKLFSDGTIPLTKSISLPEEAWNVDFESGPSALSPGQDVWNYLLSDAQELEEAAAGSNTSSRGGSGN